MPSNELTDLQRAMVEHDDDMARFDRNTMPTPKTTMTVEAALAELREMLGPRPSFQMTIYVGGDEDQWRLSSLKLPCISGTSIEQCVEQVRAWKGNLNND